MKVNQPVPKEIRKTKPVAFPLYYFYRSLRVILIMWVFLLLAVVVSPWSKYLAKTLILKNDQRQILGSEASGKEIILPVEQQSVEVVEPSNDSSPIFILNKNGQGSEKNLGIEAPIVEGISETDLTRGIGHHPDSTWPNERGNMVVAGHSFSLDADNEYGKIFERLRDVDMGDQVTIKYKSNFYIYKVFKKETVSPDNVSLMGKSEDWLLTFYTCDPPKTDWRRLVFQAELIKIE